LQCIVKEVVTVQGGEDAQMLYLAGLFPQKSHQFKGSLAERDL